MNSGISLKVIFLNCSEEKIQQRVSKAGLELTYADKFDVRLVNDILDVAKAEALKLVNDFLAE